MKDSYIITSFKVFQDENLDSYDICLLQVIMYAEGAFSKSDKGDYYQLNDEWVMKMARMKEWKYKKSIKKLKSLGYIKDERKYKHYTVDWSKVTPGGDELEVSCMTSPDSKKMIEAKAPIEIPEEKLVSNFETVSIDIKEDDDYGTVENHPQEYDEAVKATRRAWNNTGDIREAIERLRKGYLKENPSHSQAVKVYLKEYAEAN